jgi:hypothetical protein
MALLCLQATPIDSILPSPTEILFVRPIKDNLPKKIPKGTTTEELTSRLLQRQTTQKYQHDRNTKALPSLKPGQSINIKHTRKYMHAETPRLADRTIVFSEHEVFKVVVMVTR